VRYFDDFAAGQVFELGSVEITESDIVEFAKQWDPQPFHLTDEGGAASPFGGIIASGWHTASAFMRLYVDAFLSDTAAHGGAGVDELRWVRPVRPGDVLSGRATVEEVRPSATRPNRGTVRLLWEMRNQDGDVVFSAHGINLFGRRGHASP
jgi:acyl dehydratase